MLADVCYAYHVAWARIIIGYAETVKYGFINGYKNFSNGWKQMPRALPAGDAASERNVFHYVLRRQSKIVAADERESGVRALLELWPYSLPMRSVPKQAMVMRLLHGEAVAIGMRVGVLQLNPCIIPLPEKLISRRVLKHYEMTGLPTSPKAKSHSAKSWNIDALMEHFTRDKSA